MCLLTNVMPYDIHKDLNMNMVGDRNMENVETSGANLKDRKTSWASNITVIRLRVRIEFYVCPRIFPEPACSVCQLRNLPTFLSNPWSSAEDLQSLERNVRGVALIARNYSIPPGNHV